jgi:hypothetical protein
MTRMPSVGWSVGFAASHLDPFLADPTILSEGLGEITEDLDAIEEALGELARFSLIRLTPETVSVHCLLQAVEQDAQTKEECARWLEWAVRLLNAFAPESPSAFNNLALLLQATNRLSPNR